MTGTPAPATQRPAYTAWLLILGIAGVSTSVLWIRESTSPPGELAFRRLALALPVLFILSRCAGHPLLPRIRERMRVIGAGLFLAAHFWLWIASLEHLSAATSLILVCSHPVLVMALELLLRRFRGHRGIALAGIALALAGTVLLAGRSSFEGGREWGIAQALGGAAAMAGYLFCGRSARSSMPILAYGFWVYLIAALVLAIVVFGTGGALFPSDRREWTLALLLALLPTLLGHTPMNAALRHVPATVVSTAFLGEVVGGSLIVWIVLAERPPETFFTGGSLVAAGIILVGIAGTKTRTRQ